MHLLQHTRHRTASYSLTTDLDARITDEVDYSQCCHCARHFRILPGSGTVRGFCQRCNAVTCGRTACLPCVHFEKKMAMETLAIRRAIQKDRVRSALFEMLGLEP